MDHAAFGRLEAYMHTQMQDSAHDREHVYRVLYTALDIAAHEPGADADVLIAACLLHDVGRAEQFRDPEADHAQVGAEKALRFLRDEGWGEDFAQRVAACIRTHRYRSDAPPASPEAKILFDADKLDVTGAMGVARTLLYQALVGETLYTCTPEGEVCDGSGDAPPSFFQEYRFKLEKVYDRFFTAYAAGVAAGRRRAAQDFYASLLSEARAAYGPGRKILRAHLT